VSDASAFFSLVPKLYLGTTFASLRCPSAALRFHLGPNTLLPVSLAEIKTAVDSLSPDELTELAAFIRERDNAAWDRQIDNDFSENGRLSSVAEDIRAGRLREMP